MMVGGLWVSPLSDREDEDNKSNSYSQRDIFGDFVIYERMNTLTAIRGHWCDLYSAATYIYI